MNDQNFCFAVTGHRNKFDIPGCLSDLDAKDRLKMRFKNILVSILNVLKKGRSSVNSVYLFSGMADGADQIAAETVFELNDDGENILHFQAVLPMKKEIFRLTLKNQDHFDRLLERCGKNFLELPLIKNEPEYIEKLKEIKNAEFDPLRQKQYKQLGDWLVLHSQVLFAFWDGIPSSLPGSSADVVQSMLTRSQTVNSGFDETIDSAKLSGNDFSRSAENIWRRIFQLPSESKKHCGGPMDLFDQKEITDANITETNRLTTDGGPVLHFLLERKRKKNHLDPLPTNIYSKNAIPVFFWTAENRPPVERKFLALEQTFF